MLTISVNLGAYIEAYNPAIIEKYRNKENPYLYPDVDWYDELLNNTAPVIATTLMYLELRIALITL